MLRQRPRAVVARLVAAGTAASLLVPLALILPSSAQTTTVVTEPALLPVADAYVDASYPSHNYGAGEKLWIDGKPEMRAFLRFDVPESPHPISRATLRLYLSDANRTPDVALVQSTTWSEDAVTWKTAPETGAVIATTTSAKGTAWVEADVTGAVTGGGPVSLAVLPTSGRSQTVASRETTHAPQLVIERTQTDTDPDDPTTPATTYYVDATNGDDGDDGTSPDTAWRTLDRVNASTLTAGDAVLLRRGAAWTGQLAVDATGAPDAPIVVGAYGTGDRPSISGANTCVDLTGSHIVVRDLDVRGCAWAGVAISGSNNELRDSRISDTAAGVFVDWGAVDNRIIGNDLVDNDRMSVLTEEPGGDSGAFGVLLHGDGTEVAHNTISGSDAFSYDYGRDGAAIEIYGARNSHIHHNVADDNDAFAELGHSRSAGNTFAYNLVRSSLESSVFLVTRGAESSYGPVADTVVENNTVRLTGSASQGFVCHAGCSSEILTMRNNVIEAGWKVGYADGPFAGGHNLYWGGDRQFTVDPTSRAADPRFVDATAGDLRLRADSPAVDSGAPASYEADLRGKPVPVDGNGDGEAVADLGSYERVPGTDQPPTAKLTDPVDGTIIDHAGTVTVSAAATDDVGVTKVELHRDGVLVATDTTSPFTYDWTVSDAANGDHRWRATAYDTAGQRTDSAEVTVTVDITPDAQAPTYYVDAEGGNDGNDGRDPSSAWRTAWKVSTAALAPGDVVAFKRGQTFGELTLAQHGTADTPITFAAYGDGARPRFSGASSCIRVDGSHIVLRELHADACSWAGVDIRGANNRVEHSLVTHNAAGVFVRSGALENTIVHNQILDNNRMSTLTEGGDDDSGAFAVLLQGDGTEVAYNAISGSDAFSYDYGRDGAAVEIYGARNSHIHHNVAENNHTFTELGNSRSANTTFAYNQVRSSLEGSTFLVTRGSESHWGPIVGTALYNNTVTITGSGGQGFICHAGCNTDLLRMRNNIIQATWKVGYADGPIDADHNLYWDGQRQFSMGPNSMVADPRFVDVAAGDLHLRQDSPAVDAGIALTYTTDLDGRALPVDGDGDGKASPDLGAYELGR